MTNRPLGWTGEISHRCLQSKAHNLHIVPLLKNHERYTIIGVVGTLTHAGTVGGQFIGSQMRLCVVRRDRVEKAVIDPSTFVHGYSIIYKLKVGTYWDDYACQETEYGHQIRMAPGWWRYPPSLVQTHGV